MMAAVKDNDRGWKRIRKVFADGPTVKIGIQGAEAAAERDGGMTNVSLAVVHEFGAEIAHPGGTPYARIEGGAVRFVSKDHPNPIGVTAAHQISIPERSFIRAPFNANLSKYNRMLDKGAGKVIDGTMTKDQVLGIIGETSKADMQNAIANGIPPPLKAATIRRREKMFGKASSKPLIATGQLRQAITWALAPGAPVGGGK